jgi:hypothetical protein
MMNATAAEEHLENPAAGNLTSNQRRFVILIDYRNLEKGLRDQGHRSHNFDWLFGPILKKGIITFGYVFVPQMPNTRASIVQLANTHSFTIVQCPREFAGHISKEKDTVDAVMSELGRKMVDHSDCTDIAICSGDADFVPLANYARWKGKQVHVFSALKALSADFWELKGDQVQVNKIE